MPYRIRVRALVACSAASLLGMPLALQAQTPEECLPNPLVPGTCLGIETMMPGILDARPSLPTASDEMTGHRDQRRQRLAPGGQPSAESKAARTDARSRPSRSTSGGNAGAGAPGRAATGRPAAPGAAVNSVLGRAAGRPTAASPTAAPSQNQNAVDTDAAKRAKERARRRSRTPG